MSRGINDYCVGMREKLTLYDTDKYMHPTFGRNFIIHFRGLNVKPGQYSIVDDDKDPLKGDPKVKFT